MADYQVIGEMIAANDSELQTILEWIVTTFGGKVSSAYISGTSKKITFTIAETAFNDAVSTVAALKANYGSQLGDKWTVAYSPTI